MKKLQILLITSILFSGIIISSCSKDDENDSLTETKTDLLTKSKWKATAGTIEPAFNGSTDLWAISDACSKDNTVFFKSDNSVVFDEETSVCSGKSQQVTGTWSLGSDETVLSITRPGVFEE